jgi:hypothetical protein
LRAERSEAHQLHAGVSRAGLDGDYVLPNRLFSAHPFREIPGEMVINHNCLSVAQVLPVLK